MKNIKQIRESFDLITEKEENESKKLNALVRAGLYDAKKLPALKKALEKTPDKMTGQEKRMLVNLLDSLISQVTSDEQVYRKVKQNVHSMNEAKEDYLSKFDPRFKAGYPSDRDVPTVLILKRKAIRVYPDNQKVALYYSQALDKYVTIPFSDIQVGLNEAKKDDDDERINKALKKAKVKKKTKNPGAYKRVSSILKTAKVDAPVSDKLAKSKSTYGKLRKKHSVAVSLGATWREASKNKARKKALEPKLTARKQKQTDKAQRTSKIDSWKASGKHKDLSKSVPPKPNAATQSSFQGKVRAMAQKTVVEQAYRQKLQQIREQKEVNEVIALAPLVGAAATAARVAGPWLARGAAALGTKALSKGKQLYNKWKNKKKKPKRRDTDIDVDVDATSSRDSGGSTRSSSSSDRDQSNMPNYQFKASPEKYRARGASSDSALRRQRDRLDRQAQQSMMKEDVLSTLKTMVSEDIKEQTVSINEQEININNTVAKKIVLVYESVNSKNKKKIEKMLNESAASFNKVLTFALRQ